MSLVYCYGVVDGSFDISSLDKKGKRGFESGRIYLVPFKDISAVASDVSEKNFSQEAVDKSIKDMAWLAKNGQIHEKVIEEIMKIATIIPMKFCTIFKAKKNVEDMMEEKYADFKFNLDKLKDMVEMGVKVYFDSMPLKQKILQENSEIKKLEEEAEKKSPGAAYFEKQKIEILLKEKVHKKLADDKKRIFGKIKALAEEAKQNELLDKKVTGKDMLLNAVFLVKKSNAENFSGEIEKIKSGYPDIELKIWGPFPPYNFVK